MTQILIPSFVRASDVHTGMVDCQAQSMIPYLYPEDVFEATWFGLGTGCHAGIEYAIDMEAGLAETIDYTFTVISDWISDVGRENITESGSARAKRSLATIFEDAELNIRGWFDTVPPGAPNRDLLYSNLSWPPRTETWLKLTGGPQYPIKTQSDALFHTLDTQDPYFVDWKTGSSKSGRPMQLQFYYYTWKKMMNDPYAVTSTPASVGHFQYTTLGKAADAGGYWGDDVIERWIERTIAYKKHGKDNGYLPATDWWCNYCASKKRCPVFDGNWTDYMNRHKRAEWTTT